MPITPTYPGVYIEEISSGVRTITGVATSITAFIGRARKGLANEAIRIQSFSDFDRQFGGLWAKSTMSYAVQQYFLHGGRDAIIVRVHKNAKSAKINLPASSDSLVLEAASPGSWSNALRAAVDHDIALELPDRNNLFNLTLQELEAPNSPNPPLATETFRNLSIDPASPRFAKKVLEEESNLVRITADTITRPDLTSTNTVPPTVQYISADNSGDDGRNDIDSVQITDNSLKGTRKGLYALEKADIFNLLCIPPVQPKIDIDPTSILAPALVYCKARRAMLIVDPPNKWKAPAEAEREIDTLRADLGGSTFAINAIVYFPNLKMPNPLKENRTEEFAPCGAIAGILARTDAERGVWKAPAGIEASFIGVRELSYKLTDDENGRLNPKGLNCVRVFPVYGNVVWGARTLAGSDQLASEWKYVPVRRLALYIEESLYRGTQWVVFEPNDESLWAQIRLNIGAFMNNLFRQGAFQGKTPREAYLVKCDKETTTQNDINLGIVNIVVGFAPLKPAEFVIIKIQQLAGQIAT